MFHWQFFNIVKGVVGAFYNFDKDVENKKGVKHQSDEKDTNKGIWAKVKSGLSNTIDFFFGPSTLKIITLLSIAFLALSPFGTVAIAISSSSFSINFRFRFSYRRGEEFKKT